MTTSRVLIAIVLTACGMGFLWAKENARREADAFGIKQVQYINDQIATAWVDAGLQPSPIATDSEWCRRVHLDLIGRIPTIDELDAYLTDKMPTKRQDLVGKLLGDDYVDEYARHWTDVWTTLLIGRDVKNERVNRPGMRQYLRRAFSKNIPYDQFMEELVTATGINTNREGVDGFNGATNFLSGKMEEMGVENGVQATAKTAQIFLGVQVQCTQCHDHKSNTHKQSQFWELNAFFRQARTLRKRGGTDAVQWVELIDQDFAGEAGNPEEAELYYERPNGLMKVAYPVFVDGTAISKSGFLPAAMKDGTPYGTNRRHELARLIKASSFFPKAMVNRMWGYFLGYGFTKPVDDFGEHNPPSHPDLLDGLAGYFSAAGYDMKELLRWIVLSEPYSLSSIRKQRATAKPNDPSLDDPSVGMRPMFTHFYIRQMKAEQLYESLLNATQADRTGPVEDASGKKDEWLSQFVIAFGTDEGDDATTFNESIPQSLMMFNGELMKRATSTGEGGFLDQVLKSHGKVQQKIQVLYKAALSREPKPNEVRNALDLMDFSTEEDVNNGLSNLWWAILNSNEFIMNH